jgi:hypothetical protein
VPNGGVGVHLAGLEWREVAEFPQYAINAQGDIRHVRRDSDIIPFMVGGELVVIFHFNGRNYARKLNSVFATAFPENARQS